MANERSALNQGEKDVTKLPLKSVTFSPERNPMRATRYEKEMHQHRQLFRSEMKLLYEELSAFKKRCQQQMAKYAREVEKKRLETSENKSPEENTQTSEKSHDPHQKLKQEEEERVLEERKQQLIDLEADLDRREDELSRRTSTLADYENQITETENYLERRFDIIKHKESEIIRLDKELNKLRYEMEDDKLKMKDINSTENGWRTANNWDFLRSSMEQKQLTTEASLRRCRNELAVSKDTNDALNSEVAQLKQELQQKDHRAKDLEKRLSLSLYQTTRVTNNSVSKSLDFGEINGQNSWHKLRRQTHIAEVVNGKSPIPGIQMLKFNNVRSNNVAVRNGQATQSQTCALM